MPTVVEIRKAIEGLPDDAEAMPDWVGRPPEDHEPGVEILGFSRRIARAPAGGDYLSIRVVLFYLEDMDDDEDDDDDDGGETGEDAAGGPRAAGDGSGRRDLVD